ncbi:DUF6390 family protein [Antrihabitans sp. YC2-6]|uniref:DUF6390 family protein n=1 Tax=Antrihabitans sp. YC2-6 TaxID=2799498 RepID=UPI0018F3536E|nr:DUF6390 family protein [Antrihabitans sp. YC2-6]MBJ8348464.1 hypothetical protein [Antrihabitans sp. YC2-6]
MHPPGHRLFAKYAYAPNALGYCGPADAQALEAVACGRDVDLDVTAIARKFSGAWPYQKLIADLSGNDDPLDDHVVRAYWTGSELTCDLDRARFGSELLTRFASQAGSYWKHLNENLLAEAAPTHAFHVFGVYPWSRLLDSGMPQPLQVLDSCRISWGTVLEVGDDLLAVRSKPLGFDGQLYLDEAVDRQVRYRVEQGAFVTHLHVGDIVAVHWDFVCDWLAPQQADELAYWTHWQLEQTNRRLAADRGAHLTM